MQQGGGAREGEPIASRRGNIAAVSPIIKVGRLVRGPLVSKAIEGLILAEHAQTLPSHLFNGVGIAAQSLDPSLQEKGLSLSLGQLLGEAFTLALDMEQTHDPLLAKDGQQQEEAQAEPGQQLSPGRLPQGSSSVSWGMAPI